MIKVVLDSNVIISGIVFGGKPRELLWFIIEGRVSLYLSKEIIDEVLEILEVKFKFSKRILLAVGNELSSIASIVEPEMRINLIKEDEDDNRILECAVTSGSDYIISGDHHLLSLKRYHAIEIISVSDFLKLI